MPEFDPIPFGSRLKAAMADLDLDVKGLQRDLVRRTNKARGTSYGNIWSYVNGQAPLEPRREVVDALGEILDRLPDYLMFGTPPKTSREAELLLLQESEVESRPSKEPHKQAFREGLPFDRLGSVARGQLWRLWGAFYDLHCLRRELMGETLAPEDEHELGGVESAREVARALRGPLLDMDLIVPGDGTKAATPGQFYGAFGSQLDSYIIQASEALMGLVDHQSTFIRRTRLTQKQKSEALVRIREAQRGDAAPQEETQ